MFNTTSNVSRSSVNISAVSGTIVKTHPNSWFVQFQFGSELARQYLGASPYTKIDYKDVPIRVLQIMNTHDNRILVEAVKEDDLV